MDSSSSDDENPNLREALDPEFFPTDIYAKKEPKKNKEEKSNLPPSLRPQNAAPKYAFNPLEVRVTPEFQKHVFKHLTKMLNELIDDSRELRVKKIKDKNKVSSGVKLLRTSTSFLSDEAQEEAIGHYKRKKAKKRKHKQVDSDCDTSDEEKRAKQVAVSAEWILSGKATECWAPSTRGEVEVIVAKPSSKDKTLNS